MEEKYEETKNSFKKEDNGLAVLNHILGLFSGFLAPLIILLATKEESVKNHSRIALNWQISFLIYIMASLLLAFILIGVFLVLVLFILNIVFCIMAAIKANRGELWKYPLSIPFLKVKQ